METQSSHAKTNATIRPAVAVLIGRDHYQRMLDQPTWEKLRSFADVVEHSGREPASKSELLTVLPQADGCLTSWGVAQLDADVIAAAPRLKVMAHMGSSVKRFVSEALWARNVRVTTAGPVLAEDVAVTTLGLMIVGMKRIWPTRYAFFRLICNWIPDQVRYDGRRLSVLWKYRKVR